MSRSAADTAAVREAPAIVEAGLRSSAAATTAPHSTSGARGARGRRLQRWERSIRLSLLIAAVKQSDNAVLRQKTLDNAATVLCGEDELGALRIASQVRCRAVRPRQGPLGNLVLLPLTVEQNRLQEEHL